MGTLGVGHRVWSRRVAATALAAVALVFVGACGDNVYSVYLMRDAQFTDAGQTVSEKDGVARLSIELNAAATQSLTIPVFVSGTASSSDVSGVPEVVEVQAGQRTVDLSIGIVDDIWGEDDETLVLALGKAEGVRPAENRTYTLTIHDDDSQGYGATPALFVDSPTVNEGDGTARFTVSMSAAKETPVSVDYATQAGSAQAPGDFTQVAGTLSIPVGETTATVDVPLVDDALDEDVESFSLALANPQEAQLGTAVGIATLLDNDAAPGVWAADLSIDEAAGDAILSVQLDAPSGLPVAVSWATVAGTATASVDYRGASGQLRFAPGETTQQVVVPILDDALDEPDETLALELSDAENARVARPAATITIIDDDAPPALAVTGGSFDEAGGAASVTVALSAASGKPVTFTYTTVDETAQAGADYATTAGSLTLAAGATSVVIPIPLVNDTLNENPETFRLELQAADNATIATASAQVTILDDDPMPTLAVGEPGSGGAVTSASAVESSCCLELEISLSAPSGRDVTVSYATQDGTAVAGSDYTATSGSVTFAAGETSKTVTIGLLDDALSENDEVFTLALLSAEGAVLPAGLFGEGTIIDDDPLPAVSASWPGANGGSGTTVPESIGSVDITVTLSAAAGRDISVPFSIDPASTAALPADFDVTTASPLVIPAGNTQASITLTVVDDTRYELDETAIVAFGQPDFATGSLGSYTLTITDNDDPLILVSAVTRDANSDGYLDMLELTFDQPVDDSTFPGYVENSLGEPQSVWQLAGYGGLVLLHGSAVPTGDVADDNVLYLAIWQAQAPDTGAQPALSTALDAQLLSLDGDAMQPLAGVIPADGAPPVFLAATTEVGIDRLYLRFSEPASDNGNCPGILRTSGLAYDDWSGDGVHAIADGADTDGCDGRIVAASLPGPFAGSDLYTDSVTTLADRIYDEAGNAAPVITRLVTAIEHPFVLTASSVDNVTARLEYSEAMADSALDLSNYSYSAVGCDAAASLSAIAPAGPGVYLLTTSPQESGCTYTIEVTGDVRDWNEDATLVEPRLATFEGNGALRVISAHAISLRSFVISFSKDVLDSGAGGADNAGYYQIPWVLGSVQGAVRYDQVTGSPYDANKVLVIHSQNQGSAFYTVVVSTELTTPSGEHLLANPYDRTIFQGFAGQVGRIEDGPLFIDPFGDGTSFSFVFSYAGQVYVGPNDNNDAVFRFLPDGRAATLVTFSTDSATDGAPYTSFGNNLKRPAQMVEVTALGVRYYITVGSDLSTFGPGDRVIVSGCTNTSNNNSGAAAVVDDELDYVELQGASGVNSYDETCELLVFNNGGPASFDGVDAFVTADVGGESYLIFGGHNEGGGGFGEIFFTQDTDTVLDNDYCTISPVTLGNSESLQTIYGYGDYLYFGFNSDTARKPVLAYMSLDASGTTCSDLNDEVIDQSTKKAREIDYLGGNGLHPNPAPYIGIDSIIVYNDGSGPALYIANNGGIAKASDLPPTAASTWANVRHNGDGVWQGAAQTLPSFGRLRPGEKGVPFMVEWQGQLFVARNRDDNTAELWRYSPGVGWSKLVDTSDATGGMNTANGDISLLLVSGTRLYVGFDNIVDGAELWRTAPEVTATSFSSQADLEQVGVSGFGPLGAAGLSKNAQIIASTAVSYLGSDYVYIAVGCTSDYTDNGACDHAPEIGVTDFAIRIFRQVD